MITRAPKKRATTLNWPRSVLLPDDLETKVKKIIESDPELDFSSYVRRLIRQDLEKAESLEKTAA